MRIWRLWRKRPNEDMRPYIAIIKDSFREALASRVLWVFTGVIVLLLLALAPLGYQHNLTTGFAWGDMVDPPKLAKRLKEDSGKEQPSVGKRIWSLLDDEAKRNIEILAEVDPDGKRKLSNGQKVVPTIKALRDGLNKIIERRDFFESELWSDVSLTKEAKDLVG